MTTWHLPKDPSFQDLRDFCSSGALTPLSTFLCTTLPNWPILVRQEYCDHITKDCTDIPCISLVNRLAVSAAEGGQVSTFVFLFDTFLSPRSFPIPWHCLLAAAYLGSIEMAEVFEKRQKGWCNVIEGEDPIWGYTVWPTQIAKAINQSRFEYIDFMIKCGADVNIGGLEESPIRSVVERVNTDEATKLERVKFLIERGVRVRGSKAIKAARELKQGENIMKVLSEAEEKEKDIAED